MGTQYENALAQQAALILAEGGIPTWPGIGGPEGGARQFDSRGLEYDELRGDDMVMGYQSHATISVETSINANGVREWLVRYADGRVRTMTEEQFREEFRWI